MKTLKVKTLSAHNCYTTPPPPPDFVLPGLRLGSVGMLSGPGGIGKSLLALQIAIDVSCGSNLAGLSVGSQGRVLLLNAEDPRAAILHRMWSAGQRLSNEERSLSEKNLKIASLYGSDADIMKASLQDLIQSQAHGSRLVIVDTLRSFHRLDERSPEAMLSVMEYFRALCRRCKTSVLILHRFHPGHAWPLESRPRLHMVLLSPKPAPDSEHGNEQARRVVLSCDGGDFQEEDLPAPDRLYQRGECGLLQAIPSQPKSL